MQDIDEKSFDMYGLETITGILNNANGSELQYLFACGGKDLLAKY
jgi:hypothetical protein